MALITCPECGKEISEMVKTCPNCGYPLKPGTKQHILIILEKKKKFLIGVVGFIVVLSVCFYMWNISLNKYEKMALEDCKTLMGWMKNPDSFVLYDDILIYPDDEEYGDLVYISYGGTNSYGAMVRTMSAFEQGTEYIGDYDQDEEDFSNQHEYDRYLLAFLPYDYDIKIKNNYSNFIIVDADKIMKGVCSV